MINFKTPFYEDVAVFLLPLLAYPDHLSAAKFIQLASLFLKFRSR